MGKRGVVGRSVRDVVRYEGCDGGGGGGGNAVARMGETGKARRTT